DETQRGLAVFAYADASVANDDVPAVRLELNGGGEIASVVDVLKAPRSRRSMFACAHDATAFGARRKHSGMSRPSSMAFTASAEAWGSSALALGLLAVSYLAKKSSNVYCPSTTFA